MTAKKKTDWDLLRSHVWVVDHGTIRMGQIIEVNGDRVTLHLTDGTILITIKARVFLERASIIDHCEEMSVFWSRSAKRLKHYPAETPRPECSVYMDDEHGRFVPESEAREFMLLRKQVSVLREALKIYANEARWSNAIIVNVEEKLQGVATFQMLHGKSFEFAQEALLRCDEIGEAGSCY